MLVDQVYNAVSMVPGVILSMSWLRTTSWPTASAMASYIVTCVFSMAYHMNFAINNKSSPAYLRLDIFGQQLGIICNMYNSILGPRGLFLLIPGMVLCAITNLAKEDECLLTFAASGSNILLASCFNMSLVLQWLFAFACFLSGNMYKVRAGHIAWHFMCHIIIHQYYQKLPAVVI